MAAPRRVALLVVHLVDVRVEQLGNVILSLVEGDLRIAFQHGLRPTATASAKAMSSMERSDMAPTSAVPSKSPASETAPVDSRDSKSDMGRICIRISVPRRNASVSSWA